MPGKSVPWVAAVAVGYVLLFVAVFYFVPAPWSWLVAALIAFKAATFLWSMWRAANIGAGRRRQGPNGTL